MTIDEHVGSRIKRRRRQLELAHEDVAEKLGYSVSQIMRFEAGATPAKPELLVKLAGILGCKPGYFLEGASGQ